MVGGFLQNANPGFLQGFWLELSWIHIISRIYMAFLLLRKRSGVSVADEDLQGNVRW